MKRLLVLPILLLLYFCEEEGELTKNGFNIAAVPQDASLLYHGLFVPTSGVSVTGKVNIYFENNQYKVQLEAFDISEGPDLKVFLSKSATPTDFVSLGDLTTATIYNVPKEVDVPTYSLY